MSQTKMNKEKRDTRKIVDTEKKNDSQSNLQCCADMIGLFHNKLVVVERLKEPIGFALPGGRLEADESLEQCARREFKEETGFNFRNIKQIRTYSNPNRDPRGRKVSTVFVGYVSGIMKDETNKTKVVLIDLKDIEEYRMKFVFDHYRIISDWLRLNNIKKIKLMLKSKRGQNG